VEAVLRPPDALVARGEPQRDPVAEKVAVQEPDDEADPVDEGDWCLASGNKV